MAAFARYTVLDEGMFRLFRIADRTLSDLRDSEDVTDLPFTLELHRVEISQRPTYYAISHAWGSPNQGKVLVRCNGALIVVWENLFAFIYRLFLEGCRVLLWCDAICIDQGNSEEKAQQILMMRDIFQHASHVLVWLGNGTEDELQCVERISSWDPAEMTTFADVDRYAAVNDPLWQSLAKILLRSWFSRLWVVQEACLNPNVYIVLGDATPISFDLFAWSSELMHTLNQKSHPTREQRYIPSSEIDLEVSVHGTILEQSVGTEDDIVHLNVIVEHSIINVAHMERLSQEFYDKSPVTLNQILRTFRLRRTSYDQDFVFAVVGILPPYLLRGLQVRPSDAPHEVFLGASKTFLSNDPTLTLLNFIPMSRCSTVGSQRLERQHETRADAPTWMLNFTDIQSSGLMITSKENAQDGFHAGWARQQTDEGFWWVAPSVTAADCSARSLVSITSEQLVLKGFKFDVINTTKSEVNFANYRAPLDLLLWLKSCERFFTATCGSESHVMQKFFSTLVLDYRNEYDNYTNLKINTNGDYNWKPHYDELLDSLRVHAASQHLENMSERALGFYRHLKNFTEYSFFSTKNDAIGRCRSEVQYGDVVIIVRGARTPFVLRPNPQTNLYQFVGDAYVCGVMQGEVIEVSADLVEETFTIV